MRFILFIVLLFSITFSELGLEYMLVQDISICLCDGPIEGQSETEHQDSKEDESKIETLSDKDLNIHFDGHLLSADSHRPSFFQLAPYQEIHSPPPDFA